ncbi:MAG: hypothetical protein QM624_11750 [Micropruina sp.]
MSMPAPTRSHSADELLAASLIDFPAAIAVCAAFWIGPTKPAIVAFRTVITVRVVMLRLLGDQG